MHVPCIVAITAHAQVSGTLDNSEMRIKRPVTIDNCLKTVNETNNKLSSYCRTLQLKDCLSIEYILKLINLHNHLFFFPKTMTLITFAYHLLYPNMTFVIFASNL